MKRQLQNLICLGLLLFQINANAQIGGTHIFEFLDLPTSARASALGGSAIAIMDKDLTLAIGNPAVLNSKMHQHLSFSHSFHLANTSHGYFSYAHQYKPWDVTFNAGVQYISYGDFLQADEFGNVIGDFKANEYSINIGAAKQVYDKLRVGANLKFISSQLASFNSLGIAADIGAFYQDTSGLTTAALVFRNIGTQLTTFNEDNRESLPFDIQLGITRRLRHLPFRIGVTFHNIHRGNITYDDPNQVEPTSIFGEIEEGDNAFGIIVDNFFRHAIFNGEFLLGKKENFHIGLGYNHFRRRELTVTSASRSLAGFSLGFGFQVKRFKLSYGHQIYAIAGGNNHLSITTKLGRW